MAGELRDAPPPLDVRLRVRNPQWHPLIDGIVADEPYQPNPHVIKFLDELGEELHMRLQTATKVKVHDNLTRGERAAYSSLERRSDVVIGHADKNQGLFAMNTSDYTELGENMLHASHAIITAADVDVPPDSTLEDIELAVIDRTREMYSDVLIKYADLLESLKNSGKEWKVKYLKRAALRNLDTGKAYRVPNYRELKKVTKAGSRGVTGNHTSINQPFSRLNAVELHPLVKEQPQFLKDADAWGTLLQSTEVAATDLFCAFDVVRLYPSFRLDDVSTTTHAYVTEQMAARHPLYLTSTAAEEEDMMNELREITLNENYVFFNGKIWKAHTGMATGTADGSDLADIVLHVKERAIVHKYRQHIRLYKRYIDDGGLIWTGTRAMLDLFLADLRSTMGYLAITTEISDTRLVLLDVEAWKGPGWQTTGRLDTRVYRKPGSADLYITPNSEHPAHVRRSFIRGECIRYVKRSSAEIYYIQSRERFRTALLARAYSDTEIQAAFQTIDYAKRW
eukprot:SAG11_NODE_292_length_11180_cov_6.023825_9_plen_509_part_00